MRFYCSPHKRQRLYEMLNHELSSGHISPEAVVRICWQEKVPQAEQHLITVAATRGRCSEGVELAAEIARCYREMSVTGLRHILAPLLVLALVIFCLHLAASL